MERHEEINCHHNYTEQEKHFGKEVWLSRKGAISARHGEPGLIPGSMGTASYVVVGKGNRLALNSSPHGAGRAHSRAAARRPFTREQLREAMAGIEYRDTDAFIDEIPMAYKDIDQVMARRGRPCRGAPHAAPDRQRQGRLSRHVAGQVDDVSLDDTGCDLTGDETLARDAAAGSAGVAEAGGDAVHRQEQGAAQLGIGGLARSGALEQ